jgi:hypothetical protein
MFVPRALRDSYICEQTFWTSSLDASHKYNLKVADGQLMTSTNLDER